MNVNKFFEKAEEAGITSSQLQTASSSSISISLFHHEIDSYSINNDQSIVAGGIYNGKFGFCLTEKAEDESSDFLVNGIVESAKSSERTDCLEIFKGSEKYKKRTFFSKELKNQSLEEKISLIKKVENDLFTKDPEVSEVETVVYSECEAEHYFYNSYGLKLSEKSNSCAIYVGVVLKRGDEVKTSYRTFVGPDLSKFDEDKFVSEIIKEGKEKFGGKPCKAGKYPTLLDRGVFISLLSAFLSANSSIAIQKKRSYLIGKEGQQVASKKLSIDEVPLRKGPTYTYFDGEGVARENKKVVNHGILMTHFYNRETAAKANKETTGNAALSSGKIGVGTTNIVVKPGKLSKDDLIKDIKEGVYITDIAGLGTGLNLSSGDFSCQAEGFMIRDGKIAEPLDLITLAGNIGQMMMDIKGLDNNVKDTYSFSCPDALIKKMSIGGDN